MRVGSLFLWRSVVLTVVVWCGNSPVFADEPSATSTDRSAAETFTMVVMDPLSSQLACDCVEGYAQRNYEALGELLSKALNRDVRVVFNASLVTALDGEAKGRADMVIGKHSVVLSDAKRAKRKMVPVLRLTDQEGLTTQTGLIVVRKGDPARAVSDLKSYRIFFGPADCDEKSAAPMALLKSSGVSVPDEPETCTACSVGATKLMELPADEKAAAVISSYAQPLLEGCGTIKKGDLRVVGESQPVPFVTAFINEDVPADLRQQVIDRLLEVQYDVEQLIALETKDGFVPWKGSSNVPSASTAAKKK